MRAQSLSEVRVYDAPPLATRFPLQHEDFSRRSCGLASVVSPGRALFWQGEQQDQHIKVLEGVVRAVRLFENGKRQVMAFFWPGDTIRPTQASCQFYTAEAVTRCRVLKYGTTDGACTRANPCGAHEALEDMLSLTLLLGQKNSISRIASLLLRIRRHLPSDPKRPNALQILLPRADMADYVATSIETVCRTLTEFKARKLIELPTRKTIRFIDPRGLAVVAEDCNVFDQ